MVLSAINLSPIDPVILRVGPLAIRWYGVAYLAAFAFAYAALVRLVWRGTLRISSAALTDLIGWLALGVLIGGRLGWWLLYHRGDFAEPWYEPLALWHGGMSFHGGLFGVAIAMLVWTRRHHAPFLNVADCFALVAPVGLFLGRIANFINAELVGRVTDVPWAMVFPGESVARHPSQLYEALLEGPALLTLLWSTKHRVRLRDGQIAALFLIAYGLFRFSVEFTRQPDEQIGFLAFDWVTMGQLLSVLTSFAGSLLWYISLQSRAVQATSAKRQSAGTLLTPLRE
jgi:phosphatidylglycerol:prolipoprotein diacylglycerol transferase